VESSIRNACMALVRCRTGGPPVRAPRATALGWKLSLLSAAEVDRLCADIVAELTERGSARWTPHAPLRALLGEYARVRTAGRIRRRPIRLS